MALLDSEVSVEAKEVTATLLIRCLGHYCLVKYLTGDSGVTTTGAFEMVTGLFSSIHAVAGDDLEHMTIKIRPAFGEVYNIKAPSIEYIYALDLVPAQIVPEEQT